MSKKPYYPNNWRAYKDAPDETFETIGFNEFMSWKISGWELPSSVYCVIRESNPKTGKVKEYVYSRADHAEKKAHSIMLKGNEMFIATDTEVTALYPEELDYENT